MCCAGDAEVSTGRLRIGVLRAEVCDLGVSLGELSPSLSLYRVGPPCTSCCNRLVIRVSVVMALSGRGQAFGDCCAVDVMDVSRVGVDSGTVELPSAERAGAAGMLPGNSTDDSDCDVISLSLTADNLCSRRCSEG